MSKALNKLILVDVGGLGGLQDHWKPFAEDISPIIFEPNPEQARLIRGKIETYPGGKVIERALAQIARNYPLNIAKSLGCSSLLSPNDNFLRNYSVAPAFKIQQQIVVECVRYDDLYRKGEVPQPDVIKVDVQGFEYEVLNGFGSLLDECLGVQLEAHLYPVYNNQKLLGDLVSYLAEFGLMLRRLSPVNHFDGDIVEVDAWFTAAPTKTKYLCATQQYKLELMLRAWDLPPHAAQFAATTWD